MRSDRPAWVPLFAEFLSHLKIDSKELGVCQLKPYGSQHKALDEIETGLIDGVHHFVILKARQLGITTVTLALDLFWMFLHRGIQGALVTDTESNRDQFRHVLQRFIDSLPSRWKIRATANNRSQLALANGSVLNYLVAGRRGTGGLGRGYGLNLVHATECSSYGDEEGLASLISSLAETAPQRLYVFESTARGPNLFYRMWEAAKEMPDQKAIFIPWWLKEGYALKSNTRMFAAYKQPPSAEELSLLDEVQRNYNYSISINQLAWYRAERVRLLSEDAGYIEQEHPWTERQAFITTGSPFFPHARVSDAMKRAYDLPFKGYRYHFGEDFLATEIEEVERVKDTELRVWEEPDPHGVYVVGADPAYGAQDADSKSRWRDCFALQVLRCYADRVVQVAEFASLDIIPAYFARVIGHICGSYSSDGKATVRLIIEISGPGTAVFQEIGHIRQQLADGSLQKKAKEMGRQDALNTLSWYLYKRQDSLGRGYVLNWKTNYDNKRVIIGQVKDSFILNMLELQSLPLLQEMSNVTQAGSKIGAELGRDDRVLALAFAHRAWVDWERAALIGDGRTFAAEVEAERRRRENEPVADKMGAMMGAIVADFFRQREHERNVAEREKAWDDDNWGWE